MANHIQIAIDGPGGAGKSTISKAVAAKLGIVYVDTGALYRTVGYYMKDHDIDPSDTAKVVKALLKIGIDVKYENGVQCVYLNSVNLGDKIRTQEIASYASKVSAIPEVRSFLLETQKELAVKYSVIMDGRDIGTVILPYADVKIFLTASDEVRARRRYDELIAKGQSADYTQVLEEMRTRDAQDSSRAVAPLKPAPDAVLLDNSDLTFDESVEKVIAIVREKCALDD